MRLDPAEMLVLIFYTGLIGICAMVAYVIPAQGVPFSVELLGSLTVLGKAFFGDE